VISILHHRAPGSGTDRPLLIMLPGAGIEAAAFSENGLVAALHEQEPAVDIAALRPDITLYLDGGFVEALHRAVVEPALAQGYTRIWLLGISLGGMGALLYASAHGALVEGLILLAPFLGTRGTLAEMTKAGGLAAGRRQDRLPRRRSSVYWSGYRIPWSTASTLRHCISAMAAMIALRRGTGYWRNFCRGTALSPPLAVMTGAPG